MSNTGRGSDLHQPPDARARALAIELIRAARFGAIAVLEPGSGQPLASRVALASDVDGAPIFLISGLSAHTPALMADPRCSLLAGEPGRGDPLAHPRISVAGRARQIARDAQDYPRIRRRYLARQPKSALYADFGDFSFWRLEPERASLNGGFGRAYRLGREDILDPIEPAAFDALEADVIAQINRMHQADLQRCAARNGHAERADWALCSFDAQGFELIDADRLLRLTFARALDDVRAARETIIAQLAQAG